MNLLKNLSILALMLIVTTCAHAPKPWPAKFDTSPDRNRFESYGKNYVVATEGIHATQAAKKMFEMGGNAFDAAVAAGFAVSVERIAYNGIGGGGFMIIHSTKTKETIAVDYREKAPFKATKKMFQDKKGNVLSKRSKLGPLSSGVPGTVAGLLEVHERYGKLPRERVLQPSIDLAENGFVVFPEFAKDLEKRKNRFLKYKASKKLFTKSNGQVYREGELFKNPDLAKTLRSIAKKGRDGFYKGWVAKAMVRQQRATGGLIRQRDLKAYDVKFRTPVMGKYRGYEIASMPPPSSGGAHIVQILNILENDQLRGKDPMSAEVVHLLTSAMQVAFADRAKFLGDMDFVKVPIEGITSKKYAKNLRTQFPNDTARKSSAVSAGDPLPYEPEETTQISIMDKDGNTISLTQSHNYWFGSGMTVPGAGFVMNDEMDDFTAKPGVANVWGVIGGVPNAIEPQKRPLSSMSPTMVLKNGKPILALGSRGGPKIISCVVQAIVNHLEFKMPLYDAVSNVRYHHQWYPDEVLVDKPGFPETTTAQLTEMGYKINPEKTISCKTQVAAREGNRLHAVADPRGEGSSFGR